MNILLTSAGRRPYLVRWFQEALVANGLEGNVIAADADIYAPARTFADQFIEAPPVANPQYRSWLAGVLEEHRVDLAISVNDFELSSWSNLGEEETWKSLLRLSGSDQAIVEDKLEMARYFERCGIPTPKTWKGSRAVQEIKNESSLITKGRYGSASRGLLFTELSELSTTIDEAAKEVTTRDGIPACEQEEMPPEDLVVVQQRISGIEYGLDVVCDFDGRFAGVLARRKIAMRAGETDKAESVKPEGFEDIARRIAEVIPHRGTIDVDVIVDSKGIAHVIDVNPRFGGGYPFSHLAGARIPNAYVAWSQGSLAPKKWLQYEPGLISGKSVETVRIS